MLHASGKMMLRMHPFNVNGINATLGIATQASFSISEQCDDPLNAMDRLRRS
jgi:hypothetical protein